MREHERRGGVAGDHDEIGPMGGDQFAHQRDHAGDQRRFGVAPVGKERVVGDIDDSARPAAPSRPRESTVSPPSPESNTRMVGEGVSFSTAFK